MEHVGEGFDVHQSMLNGDVEEGAEGEAVAPGRVRIEGQVGKILIESVADVVHVIADSVDRGPGRGEIVGQSSADGIDAEGEEAIKLGVDRLYAGRQSAEQIPIEGFEVSDIEDDAMAFGNGAGIERVREAIAVAQ